MSEVDSTPSILSRRTLLLIILWSLFVLWMVLSLIGDLISGITPPTRYDRNPFSEPV